MAVMSSIAWAAGMIIDSLPVNKEWGEVVELAVMAKEREPRTGFDTL